MNLSHGPQRKTRKRSRAYAKLHWLAPLPAHRPIPQRIRTRWPGIALFFALILATSPPFFNGLAAKGNDHSFDKPVVHPGDGRLHDLTGLLAGSYPAFYLSAFKPVKYAQRQPVDRPDRLPYPETSSRRPPIHGLAHPHHWNDHRLPSNTLHKERPTGYSREGLFTVDMNTPDIGNHYEALRTELIQQQIFRCGRRRLKHETSPTLRMGNVP